MRVPLARGFLRPTGGNFETYARELRDPMDGGGGLGARLADGDVDGVFDAVRLGRLADADVLKRDAVDGERHLPDEVRRCS